MQDGNNTAIPESTHPSQSLRRSKRRLPTRWRRRADGRKPTDADRHPHQHDETGQRQLVKRRRFQPWIRTSHSDSQKRRFRR